MAEHLAFGTILAYGNGESPSEEFTIIGQVKDIEGPNMSRETVDVTHHQSTGGYRKFLASLRDAGEITFSVELDPSDPSHDQNTGLLALFEKDTATNFRLVFPVEGQVGYLGYAFAGFVTGYSPKAPVTGSLTADITIRVAGAITQSEIDIDDFC